MNIIKWTIKIVYTTAVKIYFCISTILGWEERYDYNGGGKSVGNMMGFPPLVGEGHTPKNTVDRRMKK